MPETRARRHSLAGKAGEIRIFKLFPGSGEDPIQGSLCHRPLANRGGGYISCSHEWGSKVESAQIIVDEVERHVTKNLHMMLMNVRKRDSIVCLWVDALCIKQNDEDEKRDQIRLISKIFRAAETTIAWLCGPNQKVHSAFEIIARRAAQAKEAFGRPMFTVEPLQDHEWTAVLELFRQSYWTRRWIIQEVLLPVNLTLQCGQQQLKWSTMETFLDSFGPGEQRDPRWKDLDDSIVGRLWKDRSTLHQFGGGLNLANLLWNYRETKCSKNKVNDTVYAFLGLVHDGHLLYHGQDDPRRLYRDVIRTCNRTGFELQVFGLFLEAVLKLPQKGNVTVQIELHHGQRGSRSPGTALVCA